jgi:hypothetical protein
MRVLVCGSQDWNDRTAIRRQLARLPAGSVVIHGDVGYDAEGRALWGKPDELAICGAAKLAGQIARELGHDVLVFTPPERLAGERDASSGPRRNARMLREGHPELVLVFSYRLDDSPDTTDCIRQAQNAGLQVHHIRE